MGPLLVRPGQPHGTGVTARWLDGFLSVPLRTIGSMTSGSVEQVVEALTAAADGLLALDLDSLTGREAMALTRAVEVARRRIDAGTDRLAGHLDETGKFGADGHRSAKDAITFLGRLPSSEAHARVHTARRLKLLPAVAAAHARGEIATEAVRDIVRLAANPRVAPLLDEVIDELFVEQAKTESHRAFVAWLRDLERAIDMDGAAADSAMTDERRRTTFTHNSVDDSYELRSHCGSLHGAIIGDVLAAFEAAELEADREAAIAEHGPDATPDQYPRTPLQRRTDALVAIFRMAAAAPGDVHVPDPVVNVVIDAETLEDELVRVAGAPTDERSSEPCARRPDEVASRRICQTLSGRPLDPSDVVACLLIGHVRRVVIDATSNVIDLGRKRRCFTGSARDAADLQAAIRRRGASMCFWGDCTSPPHRQQRDHVRPWGALGETNVANSDLGCGYHNRLKEHGYRPVRRRDGRYDLLRPDGSRITPPA
jgi:hypothetical protein